MAKLNKNCPGVKRLMREAAELATPTEFYYAAPLEDNLFEWHFSVRGQSGTSFEGGIYHGRIIFPPEYPLKPPSVILLTPNGRFEVNRKICLSISSHHPETWQPSWSIRTVLLAIVGFMPTPGKGAIGALDWTDTERKKLAKASLTWSCLTCGSNNADALPSPSNNDSDDITKETEKYASELLFQAENVKKQEEAPETSDKPQISEESGPCDAAEPAVAAPQQVPVQEPAPAPNLTPVNQNQEAVLLPTVQGGTCSLILIYFLITLISALFLRRFIKNIYSGYFEEAL